MFSSRWSLRETILSSIGIAISHNIFLELSVALLRKIIRLLQSLTIFDQKWFYQVDTSFIWLDVKWLLACPKKQNLFSKNKGSQTLRWFLFNATAFMKTIPKHQFSSHILKKLYFHNTWLTNLPQDDYSEVSVFWGRESDPLRIHEKPK